MSDGCVFCDIVDGRAPAFVVAANEFSLAILDIQPLAVGHCLVLPRRHVPWWDEMDEDETDAVFRLARTTAAKIQTAFDPDCVTMYARGRRISHTHIFLVPTYANDPVDRLFNALEGFQERTADLGGLRDPAALEAAFDRLKKS
jgi:histidine triad (HIT) family protein